MQRGHCQILRLEAAVLEAARERQVGVRNRVGRREAEEFVRMSECAQGRAIWRSECRKVAKRC